MMIMLGRCDLMEAAKMNVFSDIALAFIERASTEMKSTWY